MKRIEEIGSERHKMKGGEGRGVDWDAGGIYNYKRVREEMRRRSFRRKLTDLKWLREKEQLQRRKRQRRNVCHE